MKTYLVPMALALIAVQASALNLQVGDIKDSRTTGQFFDGLELDLKLLGDEIDEAKAIRTTISLATDSTGRDLIDPSRLENDFREVGQYGSDKKVTLKLKNPSRKAESLKEIKGSVDLYLPKRDPKAAVTVKNLKSALGKPIADSALKSAGIEVAFYTQAELKSQQKKEAEEKAKEMKAQGASDEMISMATSFMDSFSGGDENSITLKLKDPNKKLVSIEFLSAEGKKIDTNGSMSSGDTIVKYFSEKVPDNAQVVLYVASQQALLSVPVALANVTLP